MTEVEAFEFTGIYIANAHTALTLYITFTFSYLVAAYFVGIKLSNFQVMVASFLYLFASASAVLSMLGNLQWMGIAIEHSGSLAPDGMIQSEGFWEIYLGALTSFGILISLYFMWNIRHPKE